MERSMAERAACSSRMIFVVACLMRAPVEARSFAPRERAGLAAGQARDASDEVQGLARRVERKQALDHSAAHALDHLLQRLLHLPGTRRLAVAPREAGREDHVPRRPRLARFSDELVEARQLVEPLVDADHRLQRAAAARSKALALRWRRVFRQLGCREDEKQPLRLTLGWKRLQQLLEMRRLVHFARIAAMAVEGLALHQES